MKKFNVSIESLNAEELDTVFSVFRSYHQNCAFDQLESTLEGNVERTEWFREHIEFVKGIFDKIKVEELT